MTESDKTRGGKAEKELKRSFITCMESRIMKTVISSTKPITRLKTLMEEYADSKSDDLLCNIGAPVLEYLQQKGMVEQDPESQVWQLAPEEGQDKKEKKDKRKLEDKDEPKEKKSSKEKAKKGKLAK